MRLPCAIVPETGETVNHEDVFARLHFNAPVPLLTREKVWLAGPNGPPIGPLKIAVGSGVICNGSGRPIAVMRPTPFGVPPQPVQRSYPGTATNLVGLLAFSLFPFGCVVEKAGVGGGV